MNILRTDQQVAMNELYVKVCESADHLKDAANYLDAKGLSGVLKEIAAQRKVLSWQIKAAIRTLGDLPPEPDPDRESVEQLFNRIGAMVASDQTTCLLEQRLSGEKELAQSVVNARSTGLDDLCTQAVDKIEESSRLATRQLQSSLKDQN